MEWAELVVELIRVLTWPVVVIALAFLFREQLRELIAGISELTAAGVSVKREIKELKANAEDAGEDTLANVGADDAGAGGTRSRPRYPSELDEYRERAGADPVGAITGAWRAVRSIVRDVTRELGTDRPLEAGALTTAHVRTLVPFGLSEEMVDVARQLSSLRNDVVHGRRVKTDAETALNYLAAADSLVNAVRAVAESRPDRP